MSKRVSLKPTATPYSSLGLKFSNRKNETNEVTFKLIVRLRDTAEMFTLTKCHKNMTMKELKTALELVAGIPTDFQRLFYFDQCDLREDSTVSYNDIIPGSTLTLAIWPYNGWPELVRAAADGDVTKLRRAVFKPAPHPSYEKGPAPWRSHRLFSALYISAHRGHIPAVRFLIHNGANSKGQTPEGHGPLHAAAALDQVQCLQELYSSGAPLNLQASTKCTALSVSVLMGHKRGTQLLSMLHWQERASGVHLKAHIDLSELFAHQHFDSRLPTWHRGTQAQMYMAELGGRGCTGRHMNTSVRMPKNKQTSGSLSGQGDLWSSKNHGR